MFDFLTLRPPAFGFDVSDFSLKIAQLERKPKGFGLRSFGETAIAEGVLEGGEIKKEEQLVATVKKALANVKGKKVNTNYVAAALPEEQAFVQVVQLPRMAPAELKSAIYLQAENYIPYPLNTVYLDYAVIPPFHNHLDHIDILLGSLPRRIVDMYISAFEKAGLTPAVLEIEALALARAVVEKGVTPVPLLLVDVGYRRTKISIFSGYSLRFTTSITLCAQQLTQAVAEALHVDEEKAEELKQAYGLHPSHDALGTEVFQAMIPPATDFAEQIKKYMEYYETHLPHQHLAKPEKNIKKIVLCGGGANLKGLPEFLMRQLKAEVLVGNPWVNILAPGSRDLPALPFQESLRYSTALGLALRGVQLKE